jgi:hypothetical protein
MASNNKPNISKSWWAVFKATRAYSGRFFDPNSKKSDLSLESAILEASQQPRSEFMIERHHSVRTQFFVC